MIFSREAGRPVQAVALDEVATTPPNEAGGAECLVSIPCGAVVLEGNLELPIGAKGLVIFAHGSGSSRHSPRNQYVARALRDAGIGTLLVDLLTHQEAEAEASTGHLRFDLPLLASRLVMVVRWLKQQEEAENLKIGLLGASTGGGAALMAAADLPDDISAVVSRGGRPDLAGDALPRVRCPTLFVVGGYDETVIALNDDAYARLRCPKDFRIVPGASHLFEEPGKLDQVASLSVQWFCKHLAGDQ